LDIIVAVMRVKRRDWAILRWNRRGTSDCGAIKRGDIGTRLLCFFRKSM